MPHNAQHSLAAAPIIATPRLALRLWRDSDVEPLVALHADPRVTEFLPGPVTREEARVIFARQNELYTRYGTCFFAAQLQSSGELIGFIGVKYQDFAAPFAPCFEVGWRLGTQYWGSGLATEGARAVSNYAFAQLHLPEIVAFTVPANLRSRRVMERLGMLRDPSADFGHPALAADHPLSRHVLYRMSNPAGLAR